MASSDNPSTWSDVVDAEVPVHLSPGVTALANLCEVKDVRYVAVAYAQWLADVRNDEVDASDKALAPSFNWTSVFNYHPEATVFALELVSSAEAFIQLRFGHVVRCVGDHRAPLTYVSFLEVAPTNRVGVSNRRVRGLGPALVRIAADASRQKGFQGRLGLHSVASAVQFYERLGFRPHDCPNEHHELYMELDEVGAQALLKD